MRPRQVPAIPTWLLSRFVTCERGNALLGDLFEEYQAGRTTGWYWRETLAALLVSVQSYGRRLLSYGDIQLLAALIAPTLLFAGMVILSEEYRQHCPASPVLLSGSAVLTLCAGVPAIAIAFVLGFSPLRRGWLVNPRPVLVSLSVAVFAAIGFGGSALAWASAASCSMRPAVCSSSPARDSCGPRGSDGPEAQTSKKHPAHPLSRTHLN